MQQVEIRLCMYTWMIFFQWYERVSEKNDCVGSFLEPKRELVLRLTVDLPVFGEVVGTEGGEMLVCCRSRGRTGFCPLRDDGVGVLFGARTEMVC